MNSTTTEKQILTSYICQTHNRNAQYFSLEQGTAICEECIRQFAIPKDSYQNIGSTIQILTCIQKITHENIEEFQTIEDTYTQLNSNFENIFYLIQQKLESSKYESQALLENIYRFSQENASVLTFSLEDVNKCQRSAKYIEDKYESSLIRMENVLLDLQSILQIKQNAQLSKPSKPLVENKSENTQKGILSSQKIDEEAETIVEIDLREIKSQNMMFQLMSNVVNAVEFRFVYSVWSSISPKYVYPALIHASECFTRLMRMTLELDGLKIDQQFLPKVLGEVAKVGSLRKLNLSLRQCPKITGKICSEISEKLKLFINLTSLNLNFSETEITRSDFIHIAEALYPLQNLTVIS